MTYMRVKTQTGEAMIVMTEVVAIVRHLPNRENFNVDLHMKSGTIFVIPDYNSEDYEALLNMWEMFNRENWWGDDEVPRSPGYVEGGKMREI
jgi:hypothetical protein|tara:strand:- start:502 stop:777 length:276 start_codon:yes stop_codon:yes gene_type:complete